MFQYDNDFHEGTITCDTCGDEENLNGSFQQCIADAKDSGWKSHKDGNDEWVHTCPLCVHKPASEDFKDA